MSTSCPPRSKSTSETASPFISETRDKQIDYDGYTYDPTTRTPEPFLFENRIDMLFRSGGTQKQRLATEVIERISQDEQAATRAAWAAYLILTSNRPGRIDDCIGIFSRLRHTIVHEAAWDAARFHPLTPLTNEKWIADYWYVLVRAMGRIAAQSDLPQFKVAIKIASDNPIDTFREAAVEALGDIADENSLRLLNKISQHDRSLVIRDLAEQTLEDATE